MEEKEDDEAFTAATTNQNVAWLFLLFSNILECLDLEYLDLEF